MTLDDQTQAEIRQLVISSVRSVIDNANRYGLTWRRVPATVVNGSDPAAIEIILDGDDTDTIVTAVSLSGGYVTDSRVMVDIVPPAGIFVIGSTPASPSPLYRWAGRSLVTATATLDPDDYEGIQIFDVEIVGGGGAGGGAAITGASQASLGAGGGAGAYARKLISWEDMDFSQPVTIGAGGAGVSAANGNAGGTTDFQGIMNATGGAGGEFSGAAAGFGNLAGGVGGTATGGDINIRGSDGPEASRIPTGILGMLASGAASGLYGNSVRPSSSDTGSDGSDAREYGNGGAGAFNAASQGTAKIGGNGAAGLVQMTLYA